MIPGKRPLATGTRLRNRMLILVALVPMPYVNLTRFHGVFAPNCKHRVEVRTG